MKIVICGAGVIGVTTAYYLATMGHEIVVVDRRSRAGMETSFANAGQISWGYAGPWAAPGMPRKALFWWLFERHTPLVIRPRIDPALWTWLVRMLRNCTSSAYIRNKERMVRLAAFSAECLRELRAETGIRYDDAAKGTLQLFRDRKALDEAATESRILSDLGIPHVFLNRTGCVEIEPGLSRAPATIAGGLHFPGDETGDCHLFTEALAQRAMRRGVEFRFDTTIFGLVANRGRIVSVRTSRGPIAADAFVVALGSHSRELLRPLGINLPIYPVKGYSVTLPLANPDFAPRSTVMDEAHKVAITRLGNRIRVGGIAELAGYNLDRRAGPRETLVHAVSTLFSAGIDMTRARFWTGLRAMTPNGPPLLGRTAYANLFLNTGHGTLGWTMACGSGRLLAEIISGHEPSIDLEGLTLGEPDGQKTRSVSPASRPVVASTSVWRSYSNRRMAKYANAMRRTSGRFRPTDTSEATLKKEEPQ